MTPTLILLHILGGVALLLYGLRLVRMGIMRAFGTELRKILSRVTSNRFNAFFTGVLTTMVLQSSTATTMIMASLIGRGLLGLGAGIAVVLGADVGTTLVAQILTMDLSWLAPLLMIIGYILHSSKTDTDRKKQAGRIILGLGLMLFALAAIKIAAAPLKTSETLPLLLKPLENDVIFKLLFAIAITWLFHSSLAFILLLVSLADTGVLPLEMAYVFVLGANIGNVFPVILSARSEGEDGLRLPIANLMMRVIGVALCLPFIGIIRDVMIDMTGASHWSIVYFHTAFNVVLALIFLPLVPFVAKTIRRLIPDRPKVQDESTPLYLNNRELALPIVALTNASRETLRLADLTLVMMSRCRKAFEENDVHALAEVKEMDDKIDSLFYQVKTYMAKMEGNALNEEEAARHFEIMTFATNLEHIGDVIDLNLLPLVDKKIKQHKMFSSEGFGEIRELFDMVINSIQLAQTVFISEDVALARQLVEEKGHIKEAEIKTSKAHMSRLREGRPETMDTSSMHMDMIRDLRRINSLITSVAYPILEQKGQLSRTRLKPATTAEDLEERP